MADIEITVDGGTSKRLLTAGKYCDRDILVTATGGGGGKPDPPDDGKTRLYISIPPNAMPDRPPARNEVPLYIQQTVENGVTIDWGDGSEPETLPGTGNVNTTHIYRQAGDYVISLDPADGCELGFGNKSSANCVMGPTKIKTYCTMLKYVVLGSKGVTSVDDYAFQYCYSLSSVTIPGSVSRIGFFAFQLCYSLSSIVIPGNVTSISNYAFYYCYSLASIVIPSSVTSIGSSVFDRCYSLASIAIPSSVTIIGHYTFQSCDGILEYHMLPTVPPNLSNSNTFNGISPTCIIYVPVGSLEAYQTATNWSTYADQMREEGT